ncbi:hypothetical protein ACQKEX_17855 [Bacillus pumilus]|nr:hypothetical protein [Bacillus pumilus]MBU8576882.1 hypothetical protein [Bacillus pumilus]MCY7537637.1 hypothetical protein [Bacillus pumilus]MCY7572897.1 hypothetical protein [Bacillus pumilus]MEC3593466.1 hypothetical protein [Bacillus pumilus]MEC3760171.1 hypothetical protein [Bacillus pumilus]
MSKELNKMKDRFDKIVHVQGSRIIMSEYLKKEKRGIIFFFIVYIALFISSYLLIGGPATVEGPICVFLGFCFVQFHKYRSFKKDAGNKKRIGILREQHVEKTIQLEYFKKKERKTHDQT